MHCNFGSNPIVLNYVYIVCSSIEINMFKLMKYPRTLVTLNFTYRNKWGYLIWHTNKQEGVS